MKARTFGIVSVKDYVLTLTTEETARKYCDQWNNDVDGMTTGRPYRVAEFVEIERLPAGGFSIQLPDGEPYLASVADKQS